MRTALRDVIGHCIHGVDINPMSVEGQAEGSVYMGIGHAFMEQLVFGPNGQIMNPSFLEYKMPTAMDMPVIVNELLDEPDPGGPFGAKGMSEGAVIAPSPAIANAVYHATGVRVMDLPITPEKILAALEEKERKKRD